MKECLKKSKGCSNSRKEDWKKVWETNNFGQRSKGAQATPAGSNFIRPDWMKEECHTLEWLFLSFTALMHYELNHLGEVFLLGLHVEGIKIQAIQYCGCDKNGKRGRIN